LTLLNSLAVDLPVGVGGRWSGQQLGWHRCRL